MEEGEEQGGCQWEKGPGDQQGPASVSSRLVKIRVRNETAEHVNESHEDCVESNEESGLLFRRESVSFPRLTSWFNQIQVVL